MSNNKIHRESLFQRSIEDGPNIRFWLDRWDDATSLANRFPKLVALDVNIQCSMVDRENEEKNLERICENLPVNEEGRGWTWGLTFSGVFTVYSLREAMDDMILLRCRLPTIWTNTVPIKAHICNWRSSLGRLPTKENLAKRRMDIGNEMCALCNDERETGDHIFFACRKAMAVRHVLNLWKNLLPNNCANWEEFYEDHRAGSNMADDNKLREITRRAYIWVIWISKNTIFNGVQLSLYGEFYSVACLFVVLSAWVV
ncbi:hypothetical protein OSB04_un000986 [Centaurea solstitialis]|uniref:Reverse transcriptase zinc-binding domain-containing protein n=1 Tax=Centaurea solstitialis TaxID=347529 RepID=A0AA38SGC7_9ASTR|nr:hypothetical protein OSB04_un000986 [Centaurea solstitialis]